MGHGPLCVASSGLILERKKLLGTEGLVVDLSRCLNEVLQMGTDSWRKISPELSWTERQTNRVRKLRR